MILLLLVAITFTTCLTYEIPKVTNNDDGPKYILTLNDNGEVVKEYLNVTIKVVANDSDIIYNLFCKSSSKPVEFEASTAVSVLTNSNFDVSKETVFVIHGWTNNNKSSINKEIRKALLSVHDINVIVVDWSKISRKNYATAQSNVKRIGQLIAGVIQELKSKLKISLDSVTLIGFSLGAHIAGNTGKELNGQVARIIGLDPAGPLFSLSETSNRLHASDGKFVQVIHTNAGGLGADYSIGDADYWPNGGGTQAGCVLDLTGVCSHNRAFAYYAESIKDNKFVATECSSYADYKLNLCASKPKSMMGGLFLDTTVKGDFFLKTNMLSPYGRG